MFYLELKCDCAGARIMLRENNFQCVVKSCNLQLPYLSYPYLISINLKKEFSTTNAVMVDIALYFYVPQGVGRDTA